MTRDFNNWWNNDLLSVNNPYQEDTPAYWAWEGWQAGVKAAREACCAIVYGHCNSDNIAQQTVDAIRARVEA
jgi:hypothetical protein